MGNRVEINRAQPTGINTAVEFVRIHMLHCGAVADIRSCNDGTCGVAHVELPGMNMVLDQLICPSAFQFLEQVEGVSAVNEQDISLSDSLFNL